VVFVRFQLPTISTKLPCSLVDEYQHFGGTFFLHYQGRPILNVGAENLKHWYICQATYNLIPEDCHSQLDIFPF
jgi:hypothetical protein